MKSEIKIAVTIPATGDQELKLEPGTKSIIVLTGTAGLKIGVKSEDLIAAVDELRRLKEKHLPTEAVDVDKEETTNGMVFDYGEDNA